MSTNMKLICGCASDVGAVREVNQDAVFLKYISKKHQNFALGAVCDGVGGLEHGEMASGFVTEQMRIWFDEVAEWIDIAKADAELLYSHLKDAAECWNEKLCYFEEQNGIMTGTTMSLIMILRDNYHILHVGDSRIFHLRDTFDQLTADESITKIKNGTLKAYLDNYMGKTRKLSFQSITGKVVPGDMFLYCSDGLYHCLTEEDTRMIQKQGHRKKNLDEICRKTIAAMMERGEKDNISLGVIIAKKRGVFG